MKNEFNVKFVNEPPSPNRIAEVLAQCLSEQYGREIKITARKEAPKKPEAV